MGLLQKAVETYDAHEALAGKERAGHQTLAPIGHIITNASFEITIDAEGKLVDITKVEKDDAKTVIPVTEESGGRTSAPCAHPLCEQVGYLSGDNKEKYTLYIEQLENWSNSDYSHPMLKPILQYIKGKTLLSDLKNHEINPQGEEKSLIRFRVVGIGEESGACWTNQNLFIAYKSWYEKERAIQNDGSDLCMISGKYVSPANQHPKGIIPINGNAKLISANDTTNFTYRGRFTDDRQAATIGYIASQKAHNALRWVAAEQGARVVFGKRTFLCWNPSGKKVPHVSLPLIQSSSSSVSPTDYKRELTRTINGFQNELPETEGVVIAAFDAATTGRLALTYYNELQASDFIDRLKAWDENCCWWGWNPEHRGYDVIQSMPLYQIINCAFGAQREEKGSYKFVTDDRIMRQQMQNLITCRIDKGKFPKDIVHQLVIRASNPQAYDSKLYKSLLITTCAVIKKYHFDHQKEEMDMQLEENRADRSYLFGRLLAVMEKAEKDTYTDFDDGRETNAIRLQSAYCQHPLHTAKNIEAQLERAYFPRLSTSSRMYYKKLIGEIMAQLSDICKDTPNEWNRALGDTYLIGYYLQRNALYKSKKENEEDE